MADDHQVANPAFLLVREHDWWWPHRCEQGKARDLLRNFADRVNDQDSTVTGVLYVGGHIDGAFTPSVDVLAIKLNSHGTADDKTYESRRLAAEYAKLIKG